MDRWMHLEWRVDWWRWQCNGISDEEEKKLMTDIGASLTLVFRDKEESNNIMLENRVVNMLH